MHNEDSIVVRGRVKSQFLTEDGRPQIVVYLYGPPQNALIDLAMPALLNERGWQLGDMVEVRLTRLRAAG
jgi:hypothetical protein